MGVRWVAMAAVVLLQACVFLPVTHHRWDPECRVTARQMVLESVQFGYIAGCSNHGCGALLAAAGVTAAASAVVSGSVVVIGNVLYWLEGRGQCQPAAPASPVPPAVPSVGPTAAAAQH